MTLNKTFLPSFKFRTRPLAGTASGMASDSVHGKSPFLSLCSSVDSVPAFEAVGHRIDHRIDPSQWTQLQFGLFSVPTSGPQLVYQRPCYVLSVYEKVHIKDPLLLIEKSSLCGGSGFPSKKKKGVNVTI